MTAPGSGLTRRELLYGTAAAAVVAIACRGRPESQEAKAAAALRLPEDPRMLEGKRCVVTGATSGMGAVAALELARRGATVVVCGRDPGRCADRAEELRRETGRRAEVAVADLAQLDRVRGLAADLAGRFGRIDVLVNNAASYAFERTLTPDGLERTFAVNYLAHFLLTNLLLERIRASPSGRIVNVASSDHHLGSIDFGNLQGERRYERREAYGRSKLALLMFSYELARRLEGTGITVNALHPGTVASGLGSDNGLVRGWLRTRVRNVLRRGEWLTAEEGARTIVWAAAAPELAGVTGRYFDQGREARSSEASYDRDVALRLWDASAALCGLPRGAAAVVDTVDARARPRAGEGAP